MGTSASSRGSNGNSPLVPSWADDQPDKKLPQPDGQRFRAFRTAFGKAVAGGGGRDEIKRALGHYARTSTGGSAVGPRRFGNVYGAGGQLYSALRGVADGQAVPGLDTAILVGKSTDHFAQALGQLLAGDTADADRINAAVQEAVASVLDLNTTFDPSQLTPDIISSLLSEFMSLSIFQTIVEEAGGAWDRSDDQKKTASCESDLLDLIRVVVDKSLQERLQSSTTQFSGNQIKDFMREATTKAWTEWESYQ